jgi:hypothetical protein
VPLVVVLQHILLKRLLAQAERRKQPVTHVLAVAVAGMEEELQVQTIIEMVLGVAVLVMYTRHLPQMIILAQSQILNII